MYAKDVDVKFVMLTFSLAYFNLTNYFYILCAISANTLFSIFKTFKYSNILDKGECVQKCILMYLKNISLKF